MSKGNDEQAGSDDASKASRPSTISRYIFLWFIFDMLYKYEDISLRDIPSILREIEEWAQRKMTSAGSAHTPQQVPLQPTTAAAPNHFTSNNRQRNPNGTTQVLASSSTGRTETRAAPPLSSAQKSSRHINDSAARAQASTLEEQDVLKQQRLREVNIDALRHFQGDKNGSTSTWGGGVNSSGRMSSTTTYTLEPPRPVGPATMNHEKPKMPSTTSSNPTKPRSSSKPAGVLTSKHYANQSKHAPGSEKEVRQDAKPNAGVEERRRGGGTEWRPLLASPTPEPPLHTSRNHHVYPNDNPAREYPKTSRGRYVHFDGPAE
ncbi:hypothetical protein TWF679_002639 [Orbilia oligospora]|uniref:Uncharacterized protein n=1 Tax=Orbilia oligospora TaxID=2813651 RepID=A0A8H8UT05_ORBOL|nr:hypothetical protein TWF679_002639 [Orbilia oligospora]